MDDRKRERFIFRQRGPGIGGHQVDGMALYLQDSYLISQLTLSICCTFYIVVLLIKLSEASTPVSLEKAPCTYYSICTRSLVSEFSMSFCFCLSEEHQAISLAFGEVKEYSQPPQTASVPWPQTYMKRIGVGLLMNFSARPGTHPNLP